MISITCTDIFIFSALAYGISDVILNWHKYDICDKPFRLWLILNYITIIVFRTTQVICQILCDLNPSHSIKSLQSRLKWLKRVSRGTTFGVFPVLITWTVIGNFWFTITKMNENEICFIQFQNEWILIFWLFVNYLYIFTYSVVLSIGLYLYMKERTFKKNFIRFIRTIGPEHAGDISLSEFRERNENIDLLHEYGIYFFEKGLSQEQSALLPSQFVLESDFNRGFVSCPICLEDFKLKEKVRCFPFCNHLFHFPCSDNWLSRDPNCPVCTNSPLPYIIHKQQGQANMYDLYNNNQGLHEPFL